MSVGRGHLILPPPLDEPSGRAVLQLWRPVMFERRHFGFRKVDNPNFH
jgi:hypothetical protein